LIDTAHRSTRSRATTPRWSEGVAIRARQVRDLLAGPWTEERLEARAE
jgi:hypothetical protein